MEQHLHLSLYLAFCNLCQKQNDYLVSKGHPVDSNGNMVIGSDSHTTFLGLRNTIFVHTDTANLILQKESSQDVKDIYNELERQKSDLLN